ncbi:MAG: hypothetical protein GY950_27450, partial [bacterium]|nr:hypothetical protein [bacterium]
MNLKKCKPISHLAVFVIFLLSAFSFQLAATGDDISLPRFPDISPDARYIAFSYRGDIWVSSIGGGQARRVTLHLADDRRPVFSPDGKSLAFSSRRKGNYDVYIIPFEGGIPRQITFRSSQDYVTDWTPGGKQVIFFSGRDIHASSRNAGTYKIPVSGGMPTPLLNQAAVLAKLSRSTGQQLIVFNIPLTYPLRQRYRGPGNSDIYTYHLESKT